MSQRLTDFSKEVLIRANRANLYEFFLSLENSSSVEFTRGDGFARWSNPVQYAWFNAVLCARDAAPADETFVDECLAYFRTRKTDEISWWLEDGVDLESWKSLLIPRGFKWLDGPPGMSVDLNLLRNSAALPPRARIELVNDDQGMRDCVQALLHGYGFPLDWENALQEFMMGIGYEGPYKSYVAYLDGKPVATAGVFLGKDVAGIYSVATLPEARGKGIGTAVTLEPLLEARRQGYRIGILQASEMGFPIYQKMGFTQDFVLNCFFCNP